MAARGAVAAGDAIYARYSSELQNPRSCDDQVTELRQALERRGGKFDRKLVFSDSEVSGGIWEREGLQNLLRAVEDGRVKRIFVEDLSRLSRDKEDAAKIEKLLIFLNVTIETLDGMVYDGSAGSAMAFTFLSAGAAQYLKDLGAKTRRGLRGAHRNGTSTGGTCYGYRVEAKKMLVDEQQAKVVRRIFGLYLQGHGYAVIAQKLNAEGIPAPRGRRREGDGWMHSCIREMVRNPKYIGQFSFGARKWQRHPITRQRVKRWNDEADILRNERPDLAIVDREMWDAVQSKLAEHARAYGARELPHRKTPYLLTGLLKCSCCGGLMQIAGGSSDRYYRCTANLKRGTCENRLSVRESLTKKRILETISSALGSPEAVNHIRRRLAERLGSLSRDSATEAKERAGRLERTEERIRGLIVMQAEGDRSPLVAQMRADLEAQAETERNAIGDLRAEAEAPIRLPPVELITERVLALRRLAESEDVESARATLKRYLRDGSIILTPDTGADGKQAYVARADVMPLVLLTENVATPSELEPGGRCYPRVVARGRNYARTTAFTVPIKVRVAQHPQTRAEHHSRGGTAWAHLVFCAMVSASSFTVCAFT